MHYVYSTHAFDQNYNIYKLTPDGVPILVKAIAIKGGAQVADGNGYNIVTPLGVVTRISDEDAELLQKHGVCQKHIEGGFIRIEKIREDVEKVVSTDMKLPDEKEGAPMTETSLKTIQKQKGITVTAEKVDDE